MPPARFALDGSTVADDWPNFQIDGYGTWLWALGQHLLSTGQDAVPELISSLGRASRPLSRRVCPHSMFRRLGREWVRAAYLHAGLRLRRPVVAADCWTTRTCFGAQSLFSPAFGTVLSALGAM